MKKPGLLERLRAGETLTFKEQLTLIVQLSVPTILAQISGIIMQYIDASMLGRLGANESASIGLVSSSTWLFGGMCMAAGIGFSVQVTQSIGAGKFREARNIMKQAFFVTLAFCVPLVAAGSAISGALPRWLGGAPEICGDASRYFLIYILFLPVIQLLYVSVGMLQASGNMRLPSILQVIMCGLDVLFNLLLIFPSRRVGGFVLPGANLGVAGAALGTALAQTVTVLLLLYFLLARSPILHLRKEEKLKFSAERIKTAARIALPVGFERVVMCGAMIATIRIVSPLGTVSIAANSFAVTAESLCYMPGYGVSAAATTLVGQSIGAGRKELALRLGWMSTLLGMAVLTTTGLLMYLAAPWMIGILSPDPEIIALGAMALRIEAFAEPLYAVSIVASGVFQGAGDTLIPSCMNFFSMWAVRLPLAAFLAPRLGLRGVWIAMCVELCIRGLLFLIRLASKRWLKAALLPSGEEG